MKRILMVFALIALLAVPALSQAAQGLYISPKLMLSVYNTGVTGKDHLRDYGIGQYGQSTFGGSIAVGYDFYPQNNFPLRAELEVALRTNASEDWSGSRGKVEANWNTTTTFLNFYYDFHNETAFTPYVGAGIGMAFQYAGYDITDYSTGNKTTMDDHNTSFAWNAGVGLAYAINENIAVDLGYRFVGINQNEVSQGDRKIKVSPYANEFSLGARFMF